MIELVMPKSRDVIIEAFLRSANHRSQGSILQCSGKREHPSIKKELDVYSDNMDHLLHI